MRGESTSVRCANTDGSAPTYRKQRWHQDYYLQELIYHQSDPSKKARKSIMQPDQRAAKRDGARRVATNIAKLPEL
jgi:hypothetical protein